MNPAIGEILKVGGALRQTPIGPISPDTPSILNLKSLQPRLMGLRLRGKF